MHISPGELKHRVIIQKKTITQDKYKNQIENWVEHIKCWAKVNGLFGQEYYVARQINEENTIEIIVRHNKKIDCINTVDYRVIFQGKVYDIKDKDHIKFNGRWLKLKALESGIRGN